MNELLLIRRIKDSGHSARKERREGLIPGVIYGKEIGNVLFNVNALELKKELALSGEHGILRFNLE